MCPFCGEPTATFTIDAEPFCVACRCKKDLHKPDLSWHDEPASGSEEQ